jgi:hypothetical protein
MGKENYVFLYTGIQPLEFPTKSLQHKFEHLIPSFYIGL